MNALLATLLCTLTPLPIAQQQKAPAFANGLPAGTFPLAVWLQSPHNAERYRELGINLYVGLHEGPTKEHLAALDKAQMPVICQQNEVGLAHRGNTIVGWMHGDEPDNAQGRRLTGYKPPIEPWQVVETYERLRKADRTRPVLLNLGQGAAWDGWHGRGERTNHPEDYPEYVKGCDLVSFDIYPVTHTHPDVRGRLEFVGNGVRRLRQWSQDKKPVWACIETAHVDNAAVRPTAEQVRTEVWQAIASGADGIIYFAHEFAPQFVEAGLLRHSEIAAAVTAINAEVTALAPVLRSKRLDNEVAVEAVGQSAEPSDVAVRVHAHDGELHALVAVMQSTAATVTLTPKGGFRRVRVDDAPGQALVGGRCQLALPGYAVRHLRFLR
jgi:hypothetical protein